MSGGVQICIDNPAQRVLACGFAVYIIQNKSDLIQTYTVVACSVWRSTNNIKMQTQKIMQIMSWCLIAYSCTCVHASLWTLALKQLGAIWWFFVQLALNETCIQLTCRGCGILMGSLGKICHNTGITFSQGRLQHSVSFRFIEVKMIVEGGGYHFVPIVYKIILSFTKCLNIL